MQIYLLRHGIAENAKHDQSDDDRALTAEGRKKLREVLKVAKAAEVQPTRILTSPYRRAVETADIAANVLGHKEELLRTKALVPGGDPTAVWEEVRVHKGEPGLLLVGHEPLFSKLTAYLLDSPALIVDFKKGALVRVDMEQFGPRPRGILRWLLPPKIVTGIEQ